ncbi:MAG: glycosyltransferase family 2 protein [Planctomycetes bacterium]|nr:glycosyltransferase family 2 protein [Planctomycetota bacterium]
MNDPTVSIVLPTYNRAHLLSRAIDSIIAQTMKDWEIVLVDDGSIDETPDLAQDYERRLGERFVHVSQSNAGPGAARNHGIDRCRGRFVTFLDSDDEFLPTKLARQVELLERASELGLVYCDIAFVDLDGTRHESAFDEKTKLARAVPYEEIAPGFCVCRGSLFDWLIREYFVSTISGMVRRDVLGTDIRFPSDQSYAEEWLFYLRVARITPAGFVDEPLCLHHFTAGSLARTDRQANFGELRQLLLRIKAEFGDLNRTQRRVVHRNLATCTRQLAFDKYKSRNYASAAKYFTESFRCHRQWRTAVNAIQALCRARFNREETPVSESC